MFYLYAYGFTVVAQTLTTQLTKRKTLSRRASSAEQGSRILSGSTSVPPAITSSLLILYQQEVHQAAAQTKVRISNRT